MAICISRRKLLAVDRRLVTTSGKGGTTAIERENPGYGDSTRVYIPNWTKAGRVRRSLPDQGSDKITRRDEVEDQLALDQALAVGHVVELGGAVAELGDQVVAEIPLDGLELVDEDAVDKQAALGAGVIALEPVVGRDVLGVDGRLGRVGAGRL